MTKASRCTVSPHHEPRHSNPKRPTGCDTVFTTGTVSVRSDRPFSGDRLHRCGDTDRPSRTGPGQQYRQRRNRR